MNMQYWNRFKTYLNEPCRCFVPKCKAICCVNAPLPEDFLPKHKDSIQRGIYYATNIGVNDPRDTYNSVLYNTTGNPIQVIGRDQNGNVIFGIPSELREKLQIKSMEQIDALMKEYEEVKNYCPFITTQARCSVYEERPPICKDFGTASGTENICPDKASRLEISKILIKQAFNFKEMFFFYKNLIKNAIMKSEK